MATPSPVQEDQTQTEKAQTVDAGRARRFRLGARDGSRPPLGQILRELNWPLLLLIGVTSGAVWTVLLAQATALTFFAGLLPVGGGIIVGRRVKQHVHWQAGMLSAITVLSAVAVTMLLALVGAAPPAFLQQVVFLGVIALLPFPAFGVLTAYRSEQRNQQLRFERERRGGKLEKPGRVRSIEELQSLSLPQLGGFVADLFRRHEFQVKDYRFERENYLEFDMRHKDEPWVIRVTVDEKVKQGVVIQFVQRLRAEGLPRGVLITSMDFQEPAVRWAKDKPVALIDGPTLLSMND